MKRRQLFEFEDFPWFPGVLRECLTDFMAANHRICKTYERIAPKLAELMKETGTSQIVDLCSGSGGPVAQVVEVLSRDYDLHVEATLSDRYPPKSVVDRVNTSGSGIHYNPTPVDATRVPPSMAGVRTLISGFHHLPPASAKGVLEDAWRQNRPIAVFENTKNAISGLLMTAMTPAAVLALTPWMRPLRKRHILLTYALPVLPAIMTWDCFASNVRTYSTDELRAMTEDMVRDDYVWDIGEIDLRPQHPHATPYIIGKPLRPDAQSTN